MEQEQQVRMSINSLTNDIVRLVQEKAALTARNEDLQNALNDSQKLLEAYEDKEKLQEEK